MNITATNGRIYDVRFQPNQVFEIERDDETTGLRKVFIFQDLSLGNLESKRKEVIFYSYDITSDGERVNMQRHNFNNFGLEFENFLESEIWIALKNNIVTDFLKRIEFTEALSNTNLNE